MAARQFSVAGPDAPVPGRVLLQTWRELTKTRIGNHMKIGIISDTHDLLRPEVKDTLKGCDQILHGGDISSRGILDMLEEIAPVKAVRGNNDKEWAEQLPPFLDFELGGLRIYMTHKKKDLPVDLMATTQIQFPNVALRRTYGFSA